MSTNALMLVFAVVCSSFLLASSRKMIADRDTLIDSAIEEVKQEFAAMQELVLSKAQEKLHNFKKATPDAMAEGLASLKFERMVKQAEKKILQKRRLSSVQSKSAIAEALATELMHKPGSILSKREIAKIYEASDCLERLPAPPNCDSPAVINQRTANGSCNNLANPLLGASRTSLRRLIPPQFDDGISRPRGFLQSQGSPLINRGVFSSPIPSARVASISIARDREVNDSRFSHILMQWGQFMDHDLGVVPEHSNICPEGCNVPEEVEGLCYPIAVPEDDANIEVTRTGPGTSCLGFRRSLGACPVGGQEPVTGILPRAHLNLLSHYIDASMVYGHTDMIINQLRDLDSNGLLRTGDPADGTDRPLLPDADETSFVLCPPGVEGCVVAGDLRVNEHPALVVLQVIFLREHNRIARILGQNNPSFTPDDVFFTARDIVAAEIQMITYDNYLPLLLGDGFDALIPPYEDFGGYDDTIDPSIPNSFASAAFRYGHSQIQPFFERLDASYESIPEGPLPLVNAFFNTMEVRNNGIGPLLRGLLTTVTRRLDEFVNRVLTNQLFASDADSPGLDLISINIQRGRDHGLPPYLIWKQWAKRRCGMESEFANELTEIRLMQTYGSLESVDLFVGALAEEPLPGGVLGAVFGCIFVDTFIGLRNGDRFFYENTDDTALFDEAQRAEISRVSLSRIICDNTEITEIQENAFLAGQPQIECSELPSVDLTAWGGEQRCFIKIGSSFPGSQYFVLSVLRDGTQQVGVPLLENAPVTGSDTCYLTRCPRDDLATFLSVFPTGSSPRCEPQVNPNLEGSLAGSPIIYQQDLPVAEFDEPGNGIYTSFEDCENGPNALDYNCAGRASSQHNAGGQLPIESTSRTEIRDLLGGLVSDQLINEMLGDVTETSSNEEKLVSLMEEVLKEMKSAKASSHHESVSGKKKETKIAEVESDSSLVSELENLLQDLE